LERQLREEKEQLLNALPWIARSQNAADVQFNQAAALYLARAHIHRPAFRPYLAEQDGACSDRYIQFDTARG
jgi:hypothetical protein